MLLLNCEMISAPALSKIFGVNVRTIYRDIETISGAGIPLVTVAGLHGGVGIPKDFKIKKDVSSGFDISSATISLLEEYPGLLDDNEYILARHKSELSERERKTSGTENKAAAIKVTVRFDNLYKNEIERQYNLKIVSLDESGYYTAHIYIGASKNDYNKPLLVGDKCEITEPRHIREYIVNKIEAMVKIYNK
jgi:predicted DNA-binding transcriptional regulator YafY